MSKGLFITGTGTDVGKTYITGLLLKKLNDAGFNSAYYKAAMSGNEKDENGDLIPGDATFVKNISGISQDVKTMCPYIYETAVSPHLASKIEGSPVELDVVEDNYKRLASQYDYIITEGSGGIICPLRYDNKHYLLEDVIKLLDLPCLVIADAGLGTINNVVLTIDYMKTRNIAVKGIIFNRFHPGDVMEEDNKKMCEAYTGVPVIAGVKNDSIEIELDGIFLASLFE